MELGERKEGTTQGFARSGLNSELPSVATSGAFVKSRSGRREDKTGYLGKGRMSSLDFLDGGFFGFVSNGEPGEVSVGRKLAGATFLEEIFGEGGIIGSKGGLDDGVVGLVGLDNDVGEVKVSATNAADNLGK